MARKSIFQLVNMNYNIQVETQKLYNLFHNGAFFWNGHGKKSFYEAIDHWLFYEWNFRDTCLDFDEYLGRVNARIYPNQSARENQIINFLEVIENFIALYNKIANERSEYLLSDGYGFEEEFILVKNKLEEHLALTKRTYKDKIILYPKNAPLDNVIETIEDEDVQWELIRYSREDLSLYEKRKSLAILATNLYIEEDNKEKEQCLNSMIRKATNILNNLHIRHNNKTGKYMSEALSDIDEDEAKTLCDYVFNLMLIIVLLRKQPDFEKVYQDFHNKQKAAKNKKAGDENND